jgi:hypothetical protein
MDGSFVDLEKRGYVVLRDFLPADVIEQLREDYSQQGRDVTIPYLKHASPEMAELTKPRVDAVLEQVRSQTPLKVDLPAGVHYFATGEKTGMTFPWHQDHESWFIVQNHYDYLNFYIPIIKPEVTKSNLRIVPFDVLEQKAPSAYRMLVRGGASRVRSVGGRWFVMSDATGAVRMLPSSIGDYAITPELAAGDLLLMRGDVVHSTQDTETERVSFSVRISSAETVVRRSALAAGGIQKAAFMIRYSPIYEGLFRVFEKVGRDEVALKEFFDAGRAIEPVTTVDRKDFLKRLVKEKRRAGNLTRFALDAPMAVSLRTLNKANNRYQRSKSPPAAV